METKTEVPHDKLVVGRKYRIERKNENDGGLDRGVYYFEKHRNEDGYQQFYVRNDAFYYNCGLYKFYEVNQTEVHKDKETDMAGQTLYTTAVAELRENDDGSFSIDSISDEQTTDAETISQAMIARHTASALSVGKEEDMTDVVGKNSDGEWIRMDEL